VVLNRECLRWINAQRFFTVPQNELFGDADVLPQPLLLNDAGPGNGFGESDGAAVQNRNLEIVELNVGIIDADSVERGQQMLDRRNPYATAHQRRRIGDARNRSDIRPKLEIIEI